MSRNSGEAFRKRLDQSRFSTFLVAEYLHKRGYNVHIPAFDYNQNDENWLDHVDDGDLYIWKERGENHRIDVKHIATDFTGKEDFPYHKMYVADIRAIQRANPHPLAYIIVNKAATHIGIVWWKTQSYWVEETVFASNTHKMITVMACPLEHVAFREIDVR